MIEGHNTVLTVYTGSGKIVVAEAAILHYVKQGKKSYLLFAYKSIIK